MFLACLLYLVAPVSSSAFVDGVSENFGSGSKMLDWLCISQSGKKENIAMFSQSVLCTHLFAWSLAQESVLQCQLSPIFFYPLHLPCPFFLFICISHVIFLFYPDTSPQLCCLPAYSG